MAGFQQAAEAIAAFDQFCRFALKMLDDPQVLRRVEAVRRANLTYDQRRFPMTDPNHYHAVLRQELAKVLGPQRYNLLAEGYSRIDRSPGAVESPRSTPPKPVTPEAVDLAGLRYQYRQAAERDEERTGQGSS